MSHGLVIGSIGLIGSHSPSSLLTSSLPSAMLPRDKVSSPFINIGVFFWGAAFFPLFG
jgi:hypothetical protein